MVRRRRASFEVARSASVKVSVAGNQQVGYQPSSDDRIGISTFAGASLRSPRCSGLYLSPEARFCESVSVYSGPGSRIGIAAMDVEQIRRHFRPDQIRLLFVGESPPDSGKFFYSGNSQMAHYMKRVLGRELFRGAKDFFAEFKASGCYSMTWFWRRSTSLQIGFEGRHAGRRFLILLTGSETTIRAW